MSLLSAVIALLHGISFGLAIDIACCADVRLVAQSVRFSVKEVDIGLAADIGSLARLPKIVGSQSWVREVCLSARIFGAEEALRVGLVSRVFDNKETMLNGALDLANTIASKSPVAVMGTKEILKHSRDHDVYDSKFCLLSNKMEGKYGMLMEFNYRPALYEYLELGHASKQRRQNSTVIWH